MHILKEVSALHASFLALLLSVSGDVVNWNFDKRVENTLQLQVRHFNW